MKAEYDITATITFFCLLEKRSYTSFGLPSIVSTSETSSLSLCGVSTKNFAQLPSPSLSGGFPRRFLSNAISSIFEHDIEGLESGPRVSDELFCSSILSCVKVTDGVDSSMGVELELLAVLCYPPPYDRLVCVFMVRFLYAGSSRLSCRKKLLPYSSPGNDAVIGSSHFHSSESNPCDG